MRKSPRHFRAEGPRRSAAIFLGHLLAIATAQNRALRFLPARHQLRGQLPPLVLRVGFSTCGRYLLAGWGQVPQ